MEPHMCFSDARLVLGGNKMWNLAKMCAIVAGCLVATGTASAVNPLMPFVMVKAPAEPLHLGEAYGPGTKHLSGRVMARVVANCPYHIEASFEGLRHEQGKAAISAKHMSVAINGRKVPVGTGRRVPIVTSRDSTRGNGVDVPIELQVGIDGLASYPAGRYSGILVITVTAGP
jgi:hypothetical protein